MNLEGGDFVGWCYTEMISSYHAQIMSLNNALRTSSNKDSDIIQKFGFGAYVVEKFHGVLDARRSGLVLESGS